MTEIKKLYKFPCVILFCLFFISMMLVDFIKPDKEMSAMENRTLNQSPQFNIRALVNNSWTREYGEYVRDQFVLRDGWMKIHSFVEQKALMKLEIGDVWLARDNYLIAKTPPQKQSEQRILQSNINAVCNLSEGFSGNVYVMIVPSPSNILADKLRFNPSRMNENLMMDEMFNQLNESGIKTIDLRDEFRALSAAKEQVYYRTDHHWTTDIGALTAYKAFGKAAGRDASIPLESQKKTVDGFLGTNYSKALAVDAVPDTITYYDFPNQMSIEKQTNGETYWQTDTIMDYDQLALYDKYAAFLRGNNGYTHLDGNGYGRVVVIKDSYGNCFVPFLINNYEDIEVIDLRDRQSVDDVIDVDSDILVLYSFSSFSQDSNVLWLSK